jgi:hypothetical protein
MPAKIEECISVLKRAIDPCTRDPVDYLHAKDCLAYLQRYINLQQEAYGHVVMMDFVPNLEPC